MSCPFVCPESNLSKLRIIKSREEWIAVHGEATLTRIPGFTPYSYLLV